MKIKILTQYLHMYLDIQEPRVFYKMQDWTNLTVEMWSQIVQKVAVFGIGLLWNNVAKKYQKQQIVNILWRILRPKPAILPDFWDHVSTVSFLQSFIVVLTTRQSAVRKYRLISFTYFKHILRTRIGHETVRIVAVIFFFE